MLSIHVPCIFIILCYHQQMHTIISQIITLLHVSTLSCHPQGACNQCFQYMYRASFIILYNDQQMHTIISQIITMLHVSTLSCHPQGACTQCLQYMYTCIFCYFVLRPTNALNYFTNYHTATCFDTIVSSSCSLLSIPYQVTQVLQMQLLVMQFKIKFVLHRVYVSSYIVVFEISILLNL